MVLCATRRFDESKRGVYLRLREMGESRKRDFNKKGLNIKWERDPSFIEKGDELEMTWNYTVARP